MVSEPFISVFYLVKEGSDVHTYGPHAGDAMCLSLIKLLRNSLVCWDYVPSLLSRLPNSRVTDFCPLTHKETSNKSFSSKKQMKQVLLVSFWHTRDVVHI